MIDPERLLRLLLDARLPGVAYMLVWGELREGSDGYTALSDVLFEDELTRDLSQPSVRQGVYECALQYPDVRQACEKVLRENWPTSTV
jgi:hypothetical protein